MCFFTIYHFVNYESALDMVRHYNQPPNSTITTTVSKQFRHTLSAGTEKQ